MVDGAVDLDVTLVPVVREELRVVHLVGADTTTQRQPRVGRVDLHVDPVPESEGLGSERRAEVGPVGRVAPRRIEARRGAGPQEAQPGGPQRGKQAGGDGRRVGRPELLDGVVDVDRREPPTVFVGEADHPAELEVEITAGRGCRSERNGAVRRPRRDDRRKPWRRIVPADLDDAVRRGRGTGGYDDVEDQAERAQHRWVLAAGARSRR